MLSSSYEDIGSELYALADSTVSNLLLVDHHNGNCCMKLVSCYKCGCPSTDFQVVEVTYFRRRRFSFDSLALKFERVLCL